MPEGWQLLPNIAIFQERIETGFSDEELQSVTIGKGVLKQSDNDKKDGSREDKSNYKLVKQGDIAMNKMRMWQGSLGVLLLAKNHNLIKLITPYLDLLENSDIFFDYNLLKQIKQIANE